MALVTKVLLGLGLCLVFAVQSVQAAEYFRGRTIIGAGVFASGDRSILLIDVSGDKAAMAACATTRRFAIDLHTKTWWRWL